MQQLLDKVKAQIDLFEKHKELSGENFNIFSIMSMESDEVFTHSAIIAELLNPKGSHSLGSKPLELFIEQFINEEFKFLLENVSCIKEEHIGKINDDKTEGGRLDIVVKNSSGQIFVIENKIYASEQKNQLLRYYNKYENVKIFYLTLYGEDSKQVVDNENNILYQAISYKSDILEWIQECVKYAYDKPMVREVLNQYIHLIKILTNQTTNKKMSEKIIKLIKKNLKASEEIHNNFEVAVEQIRKKFLKDLKKKFVNNAEGWIIEIKKDEEKKVFGLNLINEHTNHHLIFRFNNYNEAALNIINYLDETQLVDNKEIKITDFAFKKHSLSSKSIYYIIDKKITPHVLLGTERNSKIDKYFAEILVVLNEISKNQM